MNPIEVELSSGSILSPGSIVDDYRVMRLISRGGMGEIYLARDIKLGRKVALKVIQSKFLESRSALHRFLFEARAMAKFSHPHIVTIYAAGEHNGSPYVALEYLEGQTLRQRLREERPSVREAMRMGLAITEALQEAHRHKILHRDLKPENVFLPKDGRLRVLDFGLAKVILSLEEERASAHDPELSSAYQLQQRAPFQTRSGSYCGTPQYMAPEMWSQLEVSAAVDIWALGVILYEVLAGQRPYTDSSSVELRNKVCGLEPIPPLSSWSHVPEPLARLIAHCLQKDPQRRPKASEIVLELEELLSGTRKTSAEEVNPFRGLLPFTEQHADYFFGREAEISAFLERMRVTAVLPVVGPSGAGKSSFVRAGIIPRLKEQGSWIVVQIKPGNAPLQTLVSRVLSEVEHLDEENLSLLPTQVTGPRPSGGADPVPAGEGLVRLGEDKDLLLGDFFAAPQRLNLVLQRMAEEKKSKVLVFVDQLEEIYTLVEDDQTRWRFMQAICSAADDAQDPIRVIFTLRDDFLGRLAETPQVREVLSRVTVMRSPGAEALRDILLRPVEAMGYAYDDPQLVQEMISAVRGEPACLPLLQFTTRMLWDRRDVRRKLLRRETYEAIGGVAGALAEHADGVLAGLSGTQIRIVRQMLLRLVTDESTRRVLSRARVLEGLGAEAAPVLDRLIQGRLISIRKSRGEEESDAELELAHESLIGSWDRLARWLEESREDLAFLAEVDQAADLWEKRGRREEELWQGEALAEAKRDLLRCSSLVPDRIAHFIAEASGREQRRRRRRRRRRIMGLTLLVGIALASVLAAWTLFQQNREASFQREQARLRWAEAQREGARAALMRGDLLEARAMLRGSLETEDSSLGRALWWRIKRNPLLWRKTLSLSAYDLSFLPDGHTIAVACQDKSIYLIDTRTLAVRILRGNLDQVFSVAASPVGNSLASGTLSGEVRLWDLERNTVKVLGSHQGAVQRLVFSSDGGTLASASWDKTIRLWNVRTASLVHVLRGHDASVFSIAFSPDGRWLASGGSDKTLRLWQLPSGKPIKILRGHTDGIYGLAFSPNGGTLASASLDKTLRLWSMGSFKIRRELRGHTDGIYGLAYSPDGSFLASASRDQTVRIWSMIDPSSVTVFSGHSAGIYNLAYSPDGKTLASGSMDKSICLWDATRRDERRVFSGHTDGTVNVAFSPDGKTVASASYDKTIKLWDVASGEERATLVGHTHTIHGLAFSPDGKTLVSASNDKTLRLWDVMTTSEKKIIEGHTDRIYDVAYSPDGKTLASASSDKTVRLWDAATGSSLFVLRGHGEWVLTVAYSPDGKTLASGSMDKSIRLWDTTRGTLRRVLTGHEGGVSGLAFLPDGHRLASGSWDGTVRIWDLEDGKSSILGRHKGRVYSIAIHPDGKRIGTPCADGTARIWDLESKTSIVLSGHWSEVNAIRFSSDGKLTATASDDGPIRLWEVRTGRPFWRAPALLSSPPQIFTHQGWTSLDDSRPFFLHEPQRWRRAIEQRARNVSESREGKLLCLQTFEDRLEIWDRGADALLATENLPGLTRVVATPQGCIVSAQERASLVTRSGRKVPLWSPVSAIAFDGGELLVASGKRILTFSPSGQELRQWNADIGVRAIARGGSHLVLGFAEGNIELITTGSSHNTPGLIFEDIPSSPVTQLLRGPRKTLIAGFADGFLGIWNLSNGTLLDSTRLNGAVVHLLLDNNKLFAASELGQRWIIDLGLFHVSYCELLREIWKNIPVIWEGGLPVLRGQPTQHRCLSTSF